MGRPAVNVAVILEIQKTSSEWQEAGRGLDDGDGRINNLIPVNLADRRNIPFGFRYPHLLCRAPDCWTLSASNHRVRSDGCKGALPHPTATESLRIFDVSRELTNAIRLGENNYGKQRVRLLRVARQEIRHEIQELTVGIRFEGDFETAHTQGDNKKILPTDTMKNTV